MLLSSSLLLLSVQLALAAPSGQQVFSSPVRVDAQPDLNDAAALEGLRLHVESLPEKRLVRIARPDGAEETFETTEGEKALLKFRDLKFVDVTDNQDMWEGPTPAVPEHDYPQELSLGRVHAETYLKNISIARMTSRLTEFSGFRTRYYRSAEGARSQKWLLEHVRDIAKQHPSVEVSVGEFSHSWGQNSIIARIPSIASQSSKSHDSAIIIGAHQDSANLFPFLSAPGADDDGSGTTAVVETFASLVHNGFVPKNHSVELHLYSAEEGGLLGSQAVAAAYKAKGKQVRAMFHLDVIGYVKPGTKEVMGLITDFVDPKLTDFMEKLGNEYGELPVARTQCGYACSDHASWTKIGVPSSFMVESLFADAMPKMHTTQDTIDFPGFSFEHVAAFARTAVGFVLELS